MIHYIIQVIAFQLLFLVAYDFFLKKETFFNHNRVYLLLTPIISLLLPFIKVSVISQNIPQQLIAQLGTTNGQAIRLDPVVILTTQSGWSISEILMGIYFLGIVISMGILIYKGYRLFQLRKTANKSSIQGIKVMYLPDTDAAFSFFGTMFLGRKISEKQKNTIFQHEKIHIEQRHSLDLMFFEFLRIVFWFNPLIYIFQNRVTLLQEFIADNEVARLQSKQHYCESLLSQVFQTENISFINTFFNHSLLKKRIMMLQKTKSNRSSQLKYLMLLPLVFGMLVYTSCSNDNKLEDQENTADIELAIIKTEIENIEMLSYEDSKPYFEKIQQLIDKKEPEEPELFAEVLNMLKQKVALHRETTGENPEYKRLLEKENKGNSPDDMPFAKIDRIPVFPGCTGTNEELKACMSQKISQLVKKEFDASIGEAIGLIGTTKFVVKFRIDKEGNIGNIHARSPHPDLEKEAVRVIKTLPQMTPGKHEGKTVGVLYTLPLTFTIK